MSPAIRSCSAELDSGVERGSDLLEGAIRRSALVGGHRATGVGNRPLDRAINVGENPAAFVGGFERLDCSSCQIYNQHGAAPDRGFPSWGVFGLCGSGE